ncbi:MAG: hypothetical protein JWP00_2126 [Chloroflexi bacterium]|jgi:hypothetical protein|nr:hypothetical protein [Chloroflexota bacterium]
MQQKCSKCHTNFDFEDAFCRKCGTTLAFESVVVEPAQESIRQPDRQVVTGEIITVAQGSRELGHSGADTRKMLLNLSKKVGSKVSEALKTEQGRKLTQGAATLAVAVGVELVNHAAGKLAKTNQNGGPGQKLVRQPASLAEAVLKAFEEQRAQPQARQSDNPDVEETIVHERVVIKRTWRKPQD